MSGVPRTTGPPQKLRRFRLSEVPEEVRQKAVDLVFVQERKRGASEIDLLSVMVEVKHAATEPSDIVYRVSEAAWARVLGASR